MNTSISKKTTFSYKIIYFLLIVSMITGFIYGEDSAGGGSIGDFYSTWVMIENPFTLEALSHDIKFPLHYYIGSVVFDIVKNQTAFKLIYVLVSLFIPLIFYKCLEIKYPQSDKNNLFLISLIPLMLPSVRAAAIWPNTQLTGIIFFLASLYFFLKINKTNNYKSINKDLIILLIFLSLTVYTRQIYAIIYTYFLFYFYQKYSLKLFIKICAIVVFLALPGVYSVLIYPNILKATFDLHLQNSLLVNLSIFSLYLFPIYISALIANNYSLKFDQQTILFSLFLLVSVIIMGYFFSYNFKIGGGIFMKLSLFMFKNFNIFFLTSFIGGFLIFVFCNKNKNNYILTLLILFGISAYIITHKYFEPMLIFLIFLIYSNPIIDKIINNKKSIILIFLYYFTYFSAAIFDFIFQIKSKLIQSL